MRTLPRFLCAPSSMVAITAHAFCVMNLIRMTTNDDLLSINEYLIVTFSFLSQLQVPDIQSIIFLILFLNYFTKQDSKVIIVVILKPRYR